ncbi:MAG: hypothetical protein NTV93_19185 [Verrucomicrobia bacterium]|nr:hypothetical protein [Verrucomicrobiota bacterium]
MASRAISGRPGGGKSLYSVKLLLRELFETERPIVTNLPLRLENIVKYCLAHDRDDIDVYSRIQILPDDDVPEFWRFRGNGVEPLPVCSNEQYKKGERPAFDSVLPGGVCYFIDEVHDFLNSRNWQKTGDGCLYYISKHRHLGDDVFWITQAVKNVDSQFRSVTQDYTYCRNYAKEKYRGFTKGKYFTASTYLEPLTWAQLHLNGDYQESEKFTLDKEIANCYWTSKQKLKADSGDSAKGINIKWVFGGIGLICVLLILVAIYGPGLFVRKLINDPVKKVNANLTASMAGNGSVSIGGVAGKYDPSRAGAPLSTPPIGSPAKDVFSVGVPLNSITAREVLENMVSGSTFGVNVVGSPFGNSVILTGDNFQNVTAIAETVRLMDRAKPETIVLQAVILRVNKGKGSTLGIWGTLQAVVAANGFGLGNLSFDPVSGLVTMGSITAAQEVVRLLGANDVSKYGFTVESRPMLSATSGQEAWFTSGREIPVPVTTQGNVNSQTSVNFKRVLFSFGVRPSVLPGDRIALSINQTNDDVIGSAEVGGNPVPTIATQSLYTRIELQEGQIAILGGIEVTNKGDEQSGLPLVGRIPGLSLLFGNRKKSDEKSELVVAITAFKVPSGANPFPVRKAEPVNIISDKKETARKGIPQKTQVKKKEKTQ